MSARTGIPLAYRRVVGERKLVKVGMALVVVLAGWVVASEVFVFGLTTVQQRVMRQSAEQRGTWGERVIQGCENLVRLLP